MKGKQRRSPSPAPGLQLQPTPPEERTNLLPLLFLLWGALVLLWHYVFSQELRGAGLFAILLVGPGKLAAAAALLAAGGTVIFLAARRRPASRRIGWAAPAVLGAATLAAGLTPGLQGRVLVGLFVLAVLAAAVGLGARLLRALGVRSRPAGERLAWSGALGLGTLALGFTLLGLAGLFRPWALALATLAALAAGWRDLRRLLPELAAAGRRAQARGGPLGSALLLLLIAIFAWRAAHCFSPPVRGEADYDALEYHLAAPLEWLSAGRIAFLPHNALANMPAGGEMLYAPGLALLPDFLSGYHYARLMGLAASALAAFAAAAIARRLAGRRAGLVAGTVLFSGSWLADLCAAPFVEHFLLLYATVAWGAFGAWVAGGGSAFGYRLSAIGTTPEPEGRKPKAESRSLLVVVGLAAGFAAATKYPAAVFVAAPLGAAAFLAVLLRRSRGTEPAVPNPGAAARLLRALAALGLVGALSLAMAAPWYLRNWLADGNPVYPLAGSVLPSRHWDGLKDARFRRAHAPKEGPLTALRQKLVGQSVTQLPPEQGGGPDLREDAAWWNVYNGPLWFVLLPFVPLALWRRRRGARLSALWLAALAAVYLAGWAVFTHQVHRFLWPCFGLLAALAATGAAAVGGRAGRHLVPGAALAATLFAFPTEIVLDTRLGKSPGARVLAGLDAPDAFLLNSWGPAWPMIETANRLPAGSRVLLVGEVRAPLFRVPTDYATVFDTHPLDAALESSASAEEVAAALRARGITHLYYDWGELNRLRGSPGYNVTMPDGTQRPPCFALPPAKARLLAEFEARCLEPLQAAGRQAFPSPLTGRPARTYELWRLKSP